MKCYPYQIETFVRSHATLFFLSILLLPAFSQLTYAQTVDTVITWNDYSRISSCHLSIFKRPADEKKSSVVVMSEVASNSGTPAIQDAKFVVQRVGRQFDIDPAKAYWIFRWSAASYGSTVPSAKEVLLQATFRWSKQKSLSGPTWRVIDRDQLLELTDRQWQKPESG